MLNACESVKLWYPVDEKPAKQNAGPAAKPAEAKEAPAAAPKATAETTVETPAEDGESVMFGSEHQSVKTAETPAAQEAAPAATSKNAPPIPEKPEQRANPLAMSMPVPGEPVAALPAVKARPNSIGVSALSNNFARSFDDTWENVLEVMLAAPLAIIDKSSGVIGTEWMIQQRTGGGMSLGLFGTGQRVIRLKYVVKLYDRTGETEVVVIPYTQYTEGRMWLDGKPRIQVGEHLMRLINAKMEGN